MDKNPKHIGYRYDVNKWVKFDATRDANTLFGFKAICEKRVYCEGYNPKLVDNMETTFRPWEKYQIGENIT